MLSKIKIRIKKVYYNGIIVESSKKDFLIFIISLNNKFQILIILLAGLLQGPLCQNMEA